MAPPQSHGDHARSAQKAIPGSVVLFSGCQDTQESADVSNTANFGLNRDAGPGGAGGACTASLIKALEQRSDYTWASILKQMRSILRSKSYAQIPMLSASHKLNLEERFSVLNPAPSGRRRAVLIGINYVGTEAQLAGCHNDVEMMRRQLLQQGFQDSEMWVLLDDGSRTRPTQSNMKRAMRWLVSGARRGDSLFFHYSGHGTQIPDQDGDEDDGLDEALCPVDYPSYGMLRDDDIFLLLVRPLPEGAHLTCVTDCCHSGSMMDLPYNTTAGGYTLMGDGDIAPNSKFFTKFNKLGTRAENSTMAWLSCFACTVCASSDKRAPSTSAARPTSTAGVVRAAIGTYDALIVPFLVVAFLAILIANWSSCFDW